MLCTCKWVTGCFWFLCPGSSVHWLTLASGELEEPMDRGNQLTLESLGPPELDVLLRPGDMLYIPRGVVHVAHTLGREKCE